MRDLVALILAAGVVAGCAPDTVRESGSRVDLTSVQSVESVVHCLEEQWGREYSDVSTVPYAGGRSVRAMVGSAMLMQADVLPAEGGSQVTLSTANHGILWHETDPVIVIARACAA